MTYPPSVWERAMKIQEVLTRAMSGQISWWQAAEIIGISARSMRRWRWRLETLGYDGLLDRRRGTPSPRSAPFEEVQRILRLYREKYQGFNCRHFHEIARREHEVKLSYSYVKKALQTAGLLKKKRSRGRHRLRREPKGCLGEMLHLDGSPHAWLTLVPDQKQTLIAVIDDATSRLLHAELFESESALSVMAALGDVIRTHGLPMSLYTDRASWAAHTPKAGGPLDPTKLTQVGRALQRLGIEHIRAYSPQARGRGERANRTLQDRLVNELRVEGIRTTEAANRYIKGSFLARYNEAFARPPRDPISAFVPVGGADLDQILCNEEERVVGKDNTVCFDRLKLQVSKQAWPAQLRGTADRRPPPSRRNSFDLVGAAMPGTLRCERGPLGCPHDDEGPNSGGYYGSPASEIAPPRASCEVDSTETGLWILTACGKPRPHHPVGFPQPLDGAPPQRPNCAVHRLHRPDYGSLFLREMSKDGLQQKKTESGQITCQKQTGHFTCQQHPFSHRQSPQAVSISTRLTLGRSRAGHMLARVGMRDPPSEGES